MNLESLHQISIMIVMIINIPKQNWNIKMLVSGINNFIFYKVGDKRILLLGESHTEEGCDEDEDFIDITEYFEDYLLDVPGGQILDVFIEGG